MITNITQMPKKCTTATENNYNLQRRICHNDKEVWYTDYGHNTVTGYTWYPIPNHPREILDTDTDISTSYIHKWKKQVNSSDPCLHDEIIRT